MMVSLISKGGYCDSEFWGGPSLKNGEQIFVALKTSFSHPPGCSQDPHCSIFLFSRPYFHPQITNFQKYEASTKASKLANSSFPKPQIGPIYS